MTPERLQFIITRVAFTESRLFAQYGPELIEEVNRLQAELAGTSHALDLAKQTLEQAKSQQVHCAACGGVECHRLAEIVRLTGMESDQHLVEWVEQEKERERQLRQDLSQPNPNMFAPNTTTDGTGNSEAFRELSSLARIEELESANALTQQENARLREALTSIHQRWVDGPAEWHMMAWAMNSDAEAALTAPPDDEREAWLDGRARVEPAKEKP